MSEGTCAALGTSEMRALAGGDAMPECFTVGCGFFARFAAGIVEAFANAPVASYAYGKCGM